MEYTVVPALYDHWEERPPVLYDHGFLSLGLSPTMLMNMCYKTTHHCLTAESMILQDRPHDRLHVHKHYYKINSSNAQQVDHVNCVVKCKLKSRIISQGDVQII